VRCSRNVWQLLAAARLQLTSAHTADSTDHSIADYVCAHRHTLAVNCGTDRFGYPAADSADSIAIDSITGDICSDRHSCANCETHILRPV
jgi:hypothetical protein